MCQGQSDYFVVDGSVVQTPCLSHEISIASKIQMKADIAFFSNETNRYVNVSFVWQLPDGTTITTQADSNPYFIGSSGTYSFTASNFMKWSQSGKYTIIRAQVLDSSNVNLLCCLGGSGCDSSSGGCNQIYVTTTLCTNPKYKCVNNQCISDNCDGTGNYIDNTCGGTKCIGGGPGYNCVSGLCNYVSSGAQYGSLSACQSVCSAGGGRGCPGCDPSTSMCLDFIGLGCQPATYVYGAVIGFFVLMMMSGK